jgi:hypothetical protein
MFTRALPVEEVAGEDLVEGRRRVDELVVDPHGGAVAAEAAREVVHGGAVGVAEDGRLDLDALVRLEVAELGERAVGKRELVVVEDVEQDDVVAEEPEVPEALLDRLDVVVEVGDDHEEPARLDRVGELVEGAARVRRRLGLRLLERAHDLAEVEHGRLGPDVAEDLVGVGHDPGRVLLEDHEVGDRGRERGPVAELRHRPAEAHGRRAVEEDVAAGVRVRVVLLHVLSVRLGERLPVEVLEVVARRVGPVLGELDRESVVRRRVETRDEALDDPAGDEPEAVEPGQGVGREELARGSHQLGRSFASGSFTSSRSRAMIDSDVRPSASALKFVKTRWRSTESATERTSAHETLTRPSRTARVLAPRTRYWAARVPAPQVT